MGWNIRIGSPLGSGANKYERNACTCVSFCVYACIVGFRGATYGSDSAGRGKCLIYVLYFLKVEASCDQTL